MLCEITEDFINNIDNINNYSNQSKARLAIQPLRHDMVTKVREFDKIEFKIF